MSDIDWLPETEPLPKAISLKMDRRPFSERSKLGDRGLVDFRRVCDQMGILDRVTDTIRPGKITAALADQLTPGDEAAASIATVRVEL
jgi:hypothetical protein